MKNIVKNNCGFILFFKTRYGKFTLLTVKWNFQYLFVILFILNPATIRMSNGAYSYYPLLEIYVNSLFLIWFKIQTNFKHDSSTQIVSILAKVFFPMGPKMAIPGVFSQNFEWTDKFFLDSIKTCCTLGQSVWFYFDLSNYHIVTFFWQNTCRSKKTK